MPGIQIPTGIETVNPVPADYKYGPWASLAAARAAIPQALRYDGLTVRITGLGEYNWLAADLSNNGLVVKSAGGGGSGGALAKVNSVYLVNSADVTPMGGSAANVYSTFQTAYDAADTLQQAAGGTTIVYMYVGNVSETDTGNLTLSAAFNPNIVICGLDRNASKLGTITGNYSVTLICNDVTVGDITTNQSVIITSNNCTFGTTFVSGTSGAAGNLGLLSCNNSTYGALLQSASLGKINSMLFLYCSNLNIGMISRTQTSTGGNFDIDRCQFNSSFNVTIGNISMSLNNNSGTAKMGNSAQHALEITNNCREIIINAIDMRCNNSTGSPIDMDACIAGITLQHASIGSISVNANNGKGGYLGAILMRTCKVYGSVTINNYTTSPQTDNTGKYIFHDVQFLDFSNKGVFITNRNHTINNGMTFSNIMNHSATNVVVTDVIAATNGCLIHLKPADLASTTPLSSSFIQFKNMSTDNISVEGILGTELMFSNVMVDHLFLNIGGADVKTNIVHCGQKNSINTYLTPLLLPDADVPPPIKVMQSTFWIYELTGVSGLNLLPMSVTNSFITFNASSFISLNLDLFSSTFVAYKDDVGDASCNVIGKANTSNVKMNGYMFCNLVNNNSFFDLDLNFGPAFQMRYNNLDNNNMPVADYNNVADWNALLNPGTNFGLVTVDVNDKIISLYGGNNVENLSIINSNLIDIIDEGLVNSIASGAFYGNVLLENVTLPLITDVPANAFNGTANMIDLNAPSLVTIGTSAFENSGVRQVIAADVTTIADFAFRNSPNFYGATFNGLTSIGEEAFYGTIGFGGAYYDSVTSLGLRAFMNSAVGSVSMNALVTVSESAFEGCTQLGDVTMNNMVTVGDKAFKGNTGLSQTFMTPQTIGNEAFMNCENITTGYAFLENVTSFGLRSFRGCIYLYDLPELPVTSIPDMCFMDCTNLAEVSFPNLTYAGSQSFRNTGLADVSSVNFPSLLTGDGAFAGCLALLTANLPFINYAPQIFANCTNLVSVNMPSLTTLNTLTLLSCSSLTSVNLPNVTLCEFRAFVDCSSLATISLPACTTFDSEVLSGCIALTTISIPAMTALGNTALNNQNFVGISGNTISLIVPTALMTANAGSPDGDIVYLQANNTVNVTTV